MIKLVWAFAQLLFISRCRLNQPYQIGLKTYPDQRYSDPAPDMELIEVAITVAESKILVF